MRSQPAAGSRLAAFVLWALLGAVIWAFAPVPGLALSGHTVPPAHSTSAIEAPAAMSPPSAVLARGFDSDQLQRLLTSGVAPALALVLAVFLAFSVVTSQPAPPWARATSNVSRRGPPPAA